MIRKSQPTQVDAKEIVVIIRELDKVLTDGVVGDVVEFGCYDGTTSIHLSKKLIGSGKKLFVYDSFEGLPNKTRQDVSPLGELFQPGELMATKKQFIRNLMSASAPIPIIKKAWFSDLTADDIPEKIAFAYLDGDYYSSIWDSLQLIEPKLSNSAVIVIDDYANLALPGVSVAVNEWANNQNIHIRTEQSLAIITY